ncbi:MAG: hypothetical protein M3R12_07415, partial [Actinomycetota bacterium]|nr:hypothetical protein [Actinomycetota bacterium]
ARASTAIALGGIADGVRQEVILTRLRASTPTATQVSEFAATYAAVPLRDIPGAGEVPGVDPQTPLAFLPADLARQAIVRALRYSARAERYATWAEARQHGALDEIRCTRDRLPTVGAVPLTSWMPFLELVGGSSS